MNPLPRIYNPPYGAPAAADGVLDFMQDAGQNFHEVILPAPASHQQPVGARDQVETRLDPGAGAFLCGYSATSDQAAGFKFDIILPGSGRSLFSQPIQATPNPITSPVDGSPPHFFSKWFVVPPPGQLLVRIINLATVDNECELCLHCVSPLAPFFEGSE